MHIINYNPNKLSVAHHTDGSFDLLSCDYM